MPCTYFIDDSQRLVLTTVWDVTTAEQAFSHQESLATDPRFRPEFNQLIDCTQVTKLQMNTTEIRALAKRNFFASGARRALLVNGTLLRGLARMLTTFRDLAGAKEEIQIFEDRDEAMKWLADSSEASKKI